MTSLGILSRIPAFALIVGIAACSDNPTQVTAPPQPTATEAAPNVSNADAKPPTLVMEAFFGDKSIYAGTSFSPPSDRQLYRVNLTGAGFPVGTPVMVRIMGVDANGVRFNPGSSGGGTTGIVNMTHGATCPSRYVEMYAVVTAGTRTTESNHVAMSC